MNQTPSNRTKRIHLKRVLKARKKFAKRVHRFVAGQQRRALFLQRNDSRLRRIHRIEDERIRARRNRTNETLERRRGRIEKNYVKGDQNRQARLNSSIQKTDRRLADYRSRQDERIRKHRTGIVGWRIRAAKRAIRVYDGIKNRIFEGLFQIERDTENLLAKKRVRFGIFLFVMASILVATLIFALKRKVEEEPEIVDEVPFLAFLESIRFKEYDTFEGSEEDLLWEKLNDHFDNNEVAVLGVMCNLKAESEFRAANLENYNNQIWDVDDDTYLEEVNEKYISKNDFLESRYLERTNGYRNKYHEWVNLDGGYGYAQYTSYEKKEMLYSYAEEWFSRGGPGEKYRFNIADPKMQASFVVYLLESDKYKKMDEQLRKAPTIVDACYIWLKKYEVPQDPYKDNYYTLSFKRAAAAEEIRAFCTRDKSLDAVEAGE